jgi:hypothetical protein
MVQLTETTLQEALEEIGGRAKEANERIFFRPLFLIVAPEHHRAAGRILWWKPPIRKAGGPRKRRKAIYWR